MDSRYYLPFSDTRNAFVWNGWGTVGTTVGICAAVRVGINTDNFCGGVGAPEK